MNDNDNFVANQAVSWYQASKDLKEFCRTINGDSLDAGGLELLFYYDKQTEMPKCDLESVSIADDLFFQKILDYFMEKFIPENVLPCGRYDYVCFYPDLTQILGDKEYIYHNDWPNTWCAQIMNPFVLSRDLFEVIAEQLVEQINKICMFDVRIKRIGGIPCLVSSSSIYRICNAKQFNQWIDSYNLIVKESCERGTFVLDDVFFGVADKGVEEFDLTVHWEGKDEELTQLPLSVQISQVEYECERYWENPYVVERNMRVTIDDDSIVHIKCSKNEICKTYYEKVRSSMQQISQSTWIDGVLYECVYDFDFEYEHYVKYLIDNKYEQDGIRFISILHHNDDKIRERLTQEELYQTQLCIFVGVERA